MKTTVLPSSPQETVKPSPRLVPVVTRGLGFILPWNIFKCLFDFPQFCGAILGEPC